MKHRPTEYRFTYEGDAAAAYQFIPQAKTMMRVLMNKAAFSNRAIASMRKTFGNAVVTVTKHFDQYSVHVSAEEFGEAILNLTHGIYFASSGGTPRTNIIWINEDKVWENLTTADDYGGHFPNPVATGFWSGYTYVDKNYVFHFYADNVYSQGYNIARAPAALFNGAFAIERFGSLWVFGGYGAYAKPLVLGVTDTDQTLYHPETNPTGWRGIALTAGSSNNIYGTQETITHNSTGTKMWGGSFGYGAAESEVTFGTVDFTINEISPADKADPQKTITLSNSGSATQTYTTYAATSLEQVPTTSFKSIILQGYDKNDVLNKVYYSDSYGWTKSQSLNLSRNLTTGDITGDGTYNFNRTYQTYFEVNGDKILVSQFNLTVTAPFAGVSPPATNSFPSTPWYTYTFADRAYGFAPQYGFYYFIEPAGGPIHTESASSPGAIGDAQGFVTYNDQIELTIYDWTTGRIVMTYTFPTRDYSLQYQGDASLFFDPVTESCTPGERNVPLTDNNAPLFGWTSLFNTLPEDPPLNWSESCTRTDTEAGGFDNPQSNHTGSTYGIIYQSAARLPNGQLVFAFHDAETDITHAWVSKPDGTVAALVSGFGNAGGNDDSVKFIAM